MLRFGLVIVLATGLCAADAMAHKPDREWERGRIAAGPRIAQLSLYDVETGAELDMGGMGGAMRFRASRRIAFEVGLDVLVAGQEVAGSPGQVTRVSTPLTGSVLVYGWPDSRFQPYLLAGLGVAGHTVRYEALNEQLDFSTPLVQFGLGFEYRFEVIRLDVSLRSLGMSRSAEDVERRALDQHHGLHGFDQQPVGYRPYLGDRSLEGAMLEIGLLWGF